jgi:hypothetical protein
MTESPVSKKGPSTVIWPVGEDECPEALPALPYDDPHAIALVRAEFGLVGGVIDGVREGEQVAHRVALGAQIDGRVGQGALYDLETLAGDCGERHSNAPARREQLVWLCS